MSTAEDKALLKEMNWIVNKDTGWKINMSSNKNVPWFILDEFNSTMWTLSLRLLPDYPYYFPNTKFFKDDKEKTMYKDFIVELKSDFTNIQITEFNSITNFTVIQDSEFVIVLMGNENDTSMIWNIYIKDIMNDEIQSFDKLLKKYISPDIFGIGEIDYFYYKKGDIAKKTFYKYSNEFSYIIPNLYPWLDINKLVDAFTESNENILILTGDPWVGKTTLVKYLITHFIEKNGVKDDDDVTIAYCKDEKMVEDDEFWIDLNMSEYNLLILDDFDNGLAPRTENQKDNSFVSKLLSFSDGVLDSKVKVIITTNRDLDAIDSAIMRPWRCFDVLKLRSLSVPEALDVWTKNLELSQESFDTIFDSDYEKITQSHLMSEAAMINKKRDRSYLKDLTISVKDDFIEWRTRRKVWFGLDN